MIFLNLFKIKAQFKMKYLITYKALVMSEKMHKKGQIWGKKQ